MVGAIQDRVLAALRDTPPGRDPFPHQHGPLGLSSQEFEQLRAAFPAEALRPAGVDGEYGETHRSIVHMRNLDLATLPPRKAAFLDALTSHRFSVRLAQTMIACYLDDIPYAEASRERALPQTPEFRRMLRTGNPEYQWVFTRDHEGFELPVHTDIHHKMLTLLIYCSPEGAGSLSGTAIYRAKPGDDPRDMRGTTRFPFERFDLVFQAPHAGNTFLSFCKNDVSFHGVPRCAGHPYPRDNLMFNVSRPVEA